MKLYLYNQKRDRDLDIYLDKLQIDPKVYKALNRSDNKILLIGGGYSLLQPLFITETAMNITNIDLAPPSNNALPRLKNIKGDFTENQDYIDLFDEVWALYSLPLYSPDKFSIFMFIFKSILAIKDTGVVRFYPLEYDNSSKLHTRDADYDMTTMECTSTVLEAIEYVKDLGIECFHDVLDFRDNDRIEALVTLHVNLNKTNKHEVNSELLKKIREYKFTNCRQTSAAIVSSIED